MLKILMIVLGLTMLFTAIWAAFRGQDFQDKALQSLGGIIFGVMVLTFGIRIDDTFNSKGSLMAGFVMVIGMAFATRELCFLTADMGASGGSVTLNVAVPFIGVIMGFVLTGSAGYIVGRKKSRLIKEIRILVIIALLTITGLTLYRIYDVAGLFGTSPAVWAVLLGYGCYLAIFLYGLYSMFSHEIKENMSVREDGGPLNYYKHTDHKDAFKMKMLLLALGSVLLITAVWASVRAEDFNDRALQNLGSIVFGAMALMLAFKIDDRWTTKASLLSGFALVMGLAFATRELCFLAADMSASGNATAAVVIPFIGVFMGFVLATSTGYITGKKESKHLKEIWTLVVTAFLVIIALVLYHMYDVALLFGTTPAVWAVLLGYCCYLAIFLYGVYWMFSYEIKYNMKIGVIPASEAERA